MRKLMIIAGVVWMEMLRRRDFYVLLILMATFLAGMLALNIFGLGALTGYVKEIGLLLLWGCTWVLTVNISVRQLPREEAVGTIFPLLAKPLTRWQLLLGKWLGAWLAGLAASLVFHLLLLVVVLGRGGGFNPVTLCQHFLLHGIMLGMLAAAGIMFSTRMHQDAGAALTYVFSLGGFFLLPRIPNLILHAQGLSRDMMLLVYYALPHFELFDLRIRLAYDWGSIAWIWLLAMSLYGGLMIMLMLLLGWFAYRGKQFSRMERL